MKNAMDGNEKFDATAKPNHSNISPAWFGHDMYVNSGENGM